MERFWCLKCQHGITGIHNAECPECIQKGRDPAGILKTPEETEEYILKRAEAVKLIRSKNTVKPYKSLKDVKAELRVELKKEILDELRGVNIKTVETVEVKPEIKEVIVKRGPGRPLKSPVSSESIKTLEEGGN